MSNANEGCLHGLVGHRLTINVDGKQILAVSIDNDLGSETKIIDALESLVAFMKAPKTEVTEL